ncbi:MAG: FtsX-like permease family protein [Clostridia bacterium]|nr:FtsX-like permease family protein [Clostridia bacterium]
MLGKYIIRLIRSSLGRFLAIFAIIALGVGFFAGLRVTSTAMKSAMNKYWTETNLFDFRLVSTVGFGQEDVEALQAMPGLTRVSGSFSVDFLTSENDQTQVFRAHPLMEGINEPDLISGRMPQSDRECLLDANAMSRFSLGDEILLLDSNAEEVFDSLKYQSFSIAGFIRSPNYTYYDRGTSSVGSGSIRSFVYILPSAFTQDYFTEVYVTIPPSGEIYSTKYQEAVDALRAPLEDELTRLANARYAKLISEGLSELSQAETEYQYNKDLFDSEKPGALEQIETAETQLSDLKVQIDEMRVRLDTEKDSMTSFEYATIWTAYMVLLNEYNEGMAALEDARQTLEENEKALAEAEQSIEDGREQLNAISEPSVYVLDRTTNLSYSCFKEDSEIVAGVSQVFPLFFFLVAALVCITTMTRMVEEMRTDNGTMKALGYGDFSIASLYLVYAGLASAGGSILGFLIGSKFLPMALWKVYGILYQVNRPIDFLMDWPLFIICFFSFMAASLGATAFVCKRTLLAPPADLIRPTAPLAGKRIWLEHLSKIWFKIKFLHKVSLRNIFRYKKRFVMMLLGISGCTALLIAGAGINDTIKPIIHNQFKEISKYDALVSFASEPTEDQRVSFLQDCGDKATEIDFYRLARMTSEGNEEHEIIAFVYHEPPSEFYDIHKGHKKVAWPGLGETIINTHLALNLKLSVGDTITLVDSNMKSIRLKVSGIFDNYIYDYAFFSEETFLEQLKTLPDINTSLIRFQSGTDIHVEGAKILSNRNIASVSLSEDMEKQASGMLQSLNYIVLIVIVASASLAFIVLYNLTNISIMERKREIATLKVLGFYKAETASYVFRENLLLTFFSSLFGIPLGYLLLRYIMQQINIKSLYFGLKLSPLTCVLAVILTFVFALFAELFMLKKIENINMAESLKAIE